MQPLLQCLQWRRNEALTENLAHTVFDLHAYTGILFPRSFSPGAYASLALREQPEILERIFVFPADPQTLLRKFNLNSLQLWNTISGFVL